MIDSYKLSSILPFFHPSILILNLWCLGTYCSFGQTTLSIQAYIQNRVNQLDNLSESNYLNKQFQAGWVEGMDIRTETDRFNFNRQRYLFRVSPSTPKIREAQTNLHQLYLKKLNLEQALLRKDFIEIAYEEVLVFYEAFRKLKIKEALLLVLQDQEKVWSKLSLTDNKTTKDWVAIQQDIAQLEVDIFKEQRHLETWQVEGLWLNWDNLLPIDSLLTAINLGTNTRFHFQAQEYDVDNLIIEREEGLERAEQKKIIDFVQIEYNGPHSEELEEKISLTAGFRLPFSANRKLKMEEIAIEKETLQQERRAAKQLNLHKEKEKKKELQLLIEEWTFAKNKFAEQAQKFLDFAQRDAAMTDNSPLFLLVQKEINIKRNLTILKLETSIYQTYIDYLAFTEQLYLPVYDQFLSKH